MRPPIDPETEIIGQAMLSILENMQREDIQPFLDKHHLDTILPDQWYSARTFIDLLREIGAGFGGMGNLVAVGMSVANHMRLPPELLNATLPIMLAKWNDVYHMQHRYGNIGDVITEKLSDTHYRTHHTRIYPDDMSYGVAYGMAKRWLPPGTHFKVYYNPSSPRLDEGNGDKTVIDIEWE